MSTTLSTLRTRVRDYLDEQTADRWTNAQINRNINQGVRFAQSEIDRVNPEYFLRVCTFTASAGSYQAAYPSAIYGQRIRNMQFYQGSTVATGQAYRVQPGQLEYVMENLNTSANAPDVYTPLAGYLMWAPLINKTGTFRFIYAKKEDELSADTDELTVISDEHSDIVALYAAVLAKESKEIHSGGLRATLERKLLQMSNDVQSTDTLVIPQRKID